MENRKFARPFLRSATMMWVVLAFALLVVVRAEDGHRQARATKPCPSPSGELPVLSKSRMCRCLHRPDYQDPSTADFTPTPPDIYVLDKVDIDYVNWGPTLFKDHENAICVYFGHGGTNVPPSHITPEFAIQAINEHGWPTGKWKVNHFKSTCMVPTSLLRETIGNESLYAYKDCYDGDKKSGHEEGWYTTTDMDDTVNLLHYQYEFSGKYGFAALLFVEPMDLERRPKQLKFIAEAPYRIGANPNVYMVHIESITYDVQYGLPTDKIITLVPSATDILLNLDYAYQVRTNNAVPPMEDVCLEPPPPPPPFPAFDENTCACFLEPRHPQSIKVSQGANGIANHSRLNLSMQIPPFDRNPLIDAEVTDFFTMYGDSYLYHPTVPGMENLLVILISVLPAYKDRRFREREVMIGDFRYDTGLPAGRFLDPWNFTDSMTPTMSEEMLYTAACDEAAGSKTPPVMWTRPPFPAVGKCFPPDSTSEPCYFHFHSDYYFVDCIENCPEPKYVCAVWEYTDTSTPFMFQFISNSVIYENKHANLGNYELPPGASNCKAASPTAPKDWNLLETHLYNEVYYKRSDVWIYNPQAPVKFLYVDVSNDHSLTVVDEDYLNRTRDQPDPDKICVEPATYFNEAKDNNLCLCTFWGDNIETWQTHYGRQTSCTHNTTKEFSEHFKIEFHSRNKDNVNIRVYADVTSYPKLLEDFFVLHAIYIQAIDQYGIPVGKFNKGHWVDITNPNDKDCPNDQFPPSQGPVNARYPIFDVKPCPPHAQQNFLANEVIKQYGITISSGELSNVFVYHNRWKDNFPIVCAQYTFKTYLYPKTKTIQFIAFLRIEDKNDDGHAYMVEIRSPTLPNAQDLADGTPSRDPKGMLEDKVSFPPLNYIFYKESLMPTHVHWHRPCLDPVTDPEVLFDVCRHYITTPHTSEKARPDLDEEIDAYNHICGQWIVANQNFGPSHPYTVELGIKKDALKITRDEAILDKQCFSLRAYKTRRKNALHVRFRVDGTDPNCVNFRIPYLKEAALVAYNEKGFPIGRPGGSVNFGGSFELYNHFETQGTGRHEFCDDDDIKLTFDDLIDNDRMVFHSEKGMCIYESNIIPAYQTDTSNFHQDFDVPHINYVPSMMIWGNFKRIYDGFCAIWFFPTIRLGKATAPTHVQFVMEVQIVHAGVNPIPPNAKGNRLITIRSPKYIFSYDTTTADRKDVPLLPSGFPNLIAEATHVRNLDASVSLSCHGQELPIETIKLPSDDCVCELRPVSTGPPPPNQKPLCTYKYAFYNHIYDNRLYRTCLTKENPRHGPTNFQDNDCRTKLEYPQPPEIFPNEQITLEGSDEDDFNNTIILEPFDPTHDVYYACGLIKKCSSPHADDKVEQECIRDRSCGMLVTFGKGLGEAHHPTDEVAIEVYAVARGWVAVGISPEDEKMGEDYVIECTKEGGEVNVYNSWNIKTGQQHKRNHDNYRLRGEQGLTNPKETIIRPVKSVFYQDKLYCKFYIQKKFSRKDPDMGDTHEYDLDKLYYYIMAFSHALTDPYGEEEGNLRSHVLNGGYSEEGKEKIAAGERLSPLPHEARKFRLHALFMIFAWMFFITLSIFVARYFKETLVNVKIYKMDFWYFVHVVTGVLALICLAIGTIFQLSASSGWRNIFRSNFHTYSGIVALCFFVAEIIIGCVMKRKLAAKRPIINWVHSVIGHVAYNLALFNMAFADRVAYSFLSCNFKTYCFIWMVVYYLLHAFMSYHYCWVDYIFGRSGTARRYGMFNVISQAPRISTGVSGADSSRFSLRKSRRLADLEAQRLSNATREQEQHKIVEAPGKFIRMFALVMFTVITIVYTFWAVRKIVHYPLHCYDFYELKELEEHGFN